MSDKLYDQQGHHSQEITKLRTEIEENHQRAMTELNESLLQEQANKES